MITMLIYYRGTQGAAGSFVTQMEAEGIAGDIRREPGCVRYEYFQPLDEPGTILLLDTWKDQEALDAHHASPMMKRLAELRVRFDLKMTAEKYVSVDLGEDSKYIKWE